MCTYLTTYIEIKTGGPQRKFNFYDLDKQDVSKQKEIIFWENVKYTFLSIYNLNLLEANIYNMRKHSQYRIMPSKQKKRIKM